MSFFTKKSRKSHSKYWILCILLYLVLVDESSNTFLVRYSSQIVKNNYSNTWIQDYWLMIFLFLLQIVFSALQSGFSDYYIRRRSVTLSIFATLVSVILLKTHLVLYTPVLFLSIAIKGILGNTLPLAWSSIADETKGRNTRFYLAISICALAMGSWGPLITFSYIPSKVLWGFIALGLISGIVLTFCYSDSKDVFHSNGKNGKEKLEPLKEKSLFNLLQEECHHLYRIVKKPENFLGLLAFLFSEISFYQILFRVEVLDTYQCFATIPLSVGIGYTLGTVFLKFIQSIKDRIVSAIGISISLLAISIASGAFYLGGINKIFFTFLFSFYSFGYSWFTPALFSMIMDKETSHNQGKGYGLIDSVDTIAALITFVLIFQTNCLFCFECIIMSLLLLIISFIIFSLCFLKYRKLELSNYKRRKYENKLY